MAITHGNNPEQMAQLSQQLNKGEQEINSLVKTLTAQLNQTAWEGPDAKNFRSDWEGHRSSLTQIANKLSEVSKIVMKNKQQQEQTSGA